MRLAGRICVALLVLSALFWMITRGFSPGVDVAGALLTVIFCVFAVLIRLQNAFRDAGTEAIGSRYLAGVIVTCLVAGSLLAWSIAFALEGKPAPVINAGVVTTPLTGSLTGGAEDADRWTAHREVSIEAFDDEWMRVTLTLDEGSSRPDLDLVITLADETNVLCESDKRVNWKSTGAGIKLWMYCSEFVTWSELRNLQSLHLSESQGAGPMVNRRMNPTFEG
jgi:hypothetical protein